MSDRKKEQVTVREWKRYFEQIPAELGYCEVVIGDTDPYSDTFLRAAPTEPEHVRVSGMGVQLAVVVGMDLKRQPRCQEVRKVGTLRGKYTTKSLTLNPAVAP